MVTVLLLKRPALAFPHLGLGFWISDPSYERKTYLYLAVGRDELVQKYSFKLLG